MKKAAQELVVMVPELFRATGGIQNFSKALIQACDDLTGRPVTVISRNDRWQDFPETFRKRRSIVAVGKLPARLRPAAMSAASLRFRNSFILSTHPRFTPLLRLLRKIGKCNYAAVAHGIDVWGDWAPGFKAGMAEASRILSVSEFTRQAILTQLPDHASRVHVFPNTIEGTRFYPAPVSPEVREKLQIPASARVMLSVARVTKKDAQKGFRTMLEVLPQLRRRYPDVIWVLAGKGDDLENLKDRARELGVLEACRFPGFVPDADLPDLYRMADLFVLPSKKEGFGIAFVEALASGTPVVAGNRDGSVDALAHGELGQLINPDSLPELEQAISGIFDRTIAPHLYDADWLHTHCLEKFGFEAFRQRLGENLRELGWMQT